MKAEDLAALYSERTGCDLERDVYIPCTHPDHTTEDCNAKVLVTTTGQAYIHCHSRHCHEHGESLMLEVFLAIVPEALPWYMDGWRLSSLTQLPDYSEHGKEHSVLYTRAGGTSEQRANVRSYRLDPVCAAGQPCTWTVRGKQCGKESAHKHMWQRGKGGVRGCYVNMYPGGNEDDPWFVTEGEKDAAYLAHCGYNSASYVGGSDNARYANYSPLRDKVVYIWGDNDTPGAKAAQWVYRRLVYVAKETHILVPNGTEGSGRGAADLHDLALSDFMDALAVTGYSYAGTAREFADNVLNEEFMVRKLFETTIYSFVYDGVNLYMRDWRGILVRDDAGVGPALSHLQKSLSGMMDRDIEDDGTIPRGQREARRWVARLGNAGIWKRIEAITPRTILLMKAEDEELPVTGVRIEEINKDYDLVGMSNGIWSATRGRLLTGEEAQETFVSVSVELEYDGDKMRAPESVDERIRGVYRQFPSTPSTIISWRI